MSVIKVMTINAWSGLTYKGIFRMGYFESEKRRHERFEGLVAEIDRLKPDIIGINEANPLPSFCDELARRVNYNCIWHMGVSGLRLGRFGLPVNLREGDAILAKKGLGLEFLDRTKLAGPGIVGQSFSAHTGDLTQAILGKVRIEHEEVYVCATHWHATIGGPDALELAGRIKKTYGYSGEEYKRLIKTINDDMHWKREETCNTVKWLKKIVPDKSPVILIGDLNAEPDWPEIAHLSLNGFHEAMSEGPGFTWDPETNSNIIRYYPENLDIKFNSLYDHLRAIYEKTSRRKIDYVMVNDSARFLDSGICADNLFNGNHISDHYGIYANIMIR